MDETRERRLSMTKEGGLTALVIDRRIWLRGEGSLESKLLRERDGKQCPVGILLEALGVPRDEMVGLHTADDVDISDEERERNLALAFAEGGIDVTFLMERRITKGNARRRTREGEES